MSNTKLFHRDFTLVVMGQIISLFGNSMLRFALPLYLLRETGSSALYGAVMACSFLPVIILSPMGGILADRVNKRNIMVILDFSTAVLILLFTLLLGNMGLVPLLVVTLMVLYGIQGAYQPAVQASIPLLAQGDRLLPANAVINQVNSLSTLLGPVMGGMLYGQWGIRPILLASILCFVFSAVMELFIHMPYSPRSAGPSVFSMVKSDMKESLLFIFRVKPILSRIILAISLFNLFMSAMIIVGLPVIIVNILNLSDQLLGYSQGALAAGGLAGGVLAGLLAKRLVIQRAHRLLLYCSLGTLPIGLVLLTGASPLVCYLVITIMGFLLMAFSTLFTVEMLSFVQIQTPPELTGKVISCLMALSMCSQPLGQSLYGLLFDTFQNVPGLIVLGAALAAAVISLISRKAFHNLT